MAEGQVRERFDTSHSFPHPSAAKNAALCPLPEGEGFGSGMNSELLRIEPGVWAGTPQQLRVRSFLDHTAMVEHKDARSRADRRKTMRDDEADSSLQYRINCRLNLPFRL